MIGFIVCSELIRKGSWNKTFAYFQESSLWVGQSDADLPKGVEETGSRNFSSPVKSTEWKSLTGSNGTWNIGIIGIVGLQREREREIESETFAMTAGEAWNWQGTFVAVCCGVKEVSLIDANASTIASSLHSSRLKSLWVFYIVVFVVLFHQKREWCAYL